MNIQDFVNFGEGVNAPSGEGDTPIPYTKAQIDATVATLNAAIAAKQGNLGFTPVQQGGGTSQTTNKIYIGWSTASKMRVQIDNTDFDINWPININGTAAKVFAGGVTTGAQMIFNWSGQTGQPTWIWGGSDGTNMFVYNPSNFNVAHAVNSDQLGGQTLAQVNAAIALKADTTAMNTALALKAPLASPSFTGSVISTSGNSRIVVQQDNAGAMDIEATLSTDNTVKHILHLNRFGGGVTVNGQAVWTAGTFNPANYLPLTGGTLSGVLASNSEFQTTSAMGFRVKASTRSATFYFDNTNAYVLFSDTPTGTFNSLRPLRISTDNNCYSGGSFISAGNVLAGNGSASYQTDGNVAGPVWDQWGAHDCFSAIANRIEQRCQAFINAYAITQSRMAGEASFNRSSVTGKWQNSAYVFTAVQGTSSGGDATYFSRQPQLLIPNAGWFAAFPF